MNTAFKYKKPTIGVFGDCMLDIIFLKLPMKHRFLFF